MVTTQTQATRQAAISAEVATHVAAQLAAATQQQQAAIQQPQTINHQNQYVPTDPDVDFEKISKKFINKSLPLCPGEPTYNHYVKVRKMLYRNLRQIKSPFGGGTHGHLGAIQSVQMYANSSATAWIVPISQPAVPIIPAGTNPQDTAKIFNQWFIREKGIQTAECVTCHMHNLILAAWPDE